MTRVQLLLLSSLLAFMFVGAASRPARAQVVSVDVGFPSAAFIATAQPEYYEGRPVYYYGDRWYYRDHGRWSYYGSEPGYLHERRARWGYDHRGGYEHRGYEHRGYEHRGYARGYAGARYHYRR